MKTKDFLGHEWDVDCVGCAISNGLMVVPGGIIQKTQYFCVVQDPAIPLPGFLVINSLRHFQSMVEMQDVEYTEFSTLLRATHQTIKKVTGVEYLTMVQEERSIHFHLWFFPWTRSVIEKYGEPSLSNIREIMSDFRQHSISDMKWKELEESIEKIKLYGKGI
jgi:diadenosine tetraphosphate (Ap4A) HIT family hydrolase